MSLEIELTDLARSLLSASATFQSQVGVTDAATALASVVELDDGTPSGAHGVVESAEVLTLERVGAESFQGLAEVTIGLYLPPDASLASDTARLRSARVAVAGIRGDMLGRSDVMGWKASRVQRFDDGDALPGWYACAITLSVLVTA